MEKPAPSTGIDGGVAAPPAGFVKRFWAWIVLLFMGMAWGYSISLAKMAVAGGAHPFGVTLWTSALSAES